MGNCSSDGCWPTKRDERQSGQRRSTAIRPGLKALFMTGYAEIAVLGRGILHPDMQIITKPLQIA